MFNFVQPGLLGDLRFFESEFVEHIMKGGFSKASELEVEVSQQCIEKLKTDALSHILRRTKQ